MVILRFIQFYLSNDLASQGFEYTAVTSQAELLQKDNEVLQQRILQAEALITIHDKALQMGMVKPTIYILSGKRLEILR